MSSSQKISPNNTYVIDEDLLDEMDSIELTGLLNELSEQFVDAEATGSADEGAAAGTGSADDAADSLEIEGDDAPTPD